MLQTTTQTLSSLIHLLIPLGNEILVLLSGVAMVIFFYGVVRYVYAAGDESTAEKAKTMIVWGIISLVVILCIGGILTLLQSSLFGGSYE